MIKQSYNVLKKLVTLDSESAKFHGFKNLLKQVVVSNLLSPTNSAKGLQRRTRTVRRCLVKRRIADPHIRSVLCLWVHVHSVGCGRQWRGPITSTAQMRCISKKSRRKGGSGWQERTAISFDDLNASSGRFLAFSLRRDPSTARLSLVLLNCFLATAA